jgi:nitroreductase
MNVIEAIHKRQSVGKVKSEPVPRSEIEKLLGSAVQSPNHYNTRPWRFVVLTGGGRNRLGAVLADSLRAKFPEIDEKALEKERAKPLRSPVIIAVGVDLPAEPRIVKIENTCAAAAACQNILLAALELGMAGYWRTGGTVRDPVVKRFLGFEPAQDLIAFLYLGFSEGPPEIRERPGFEDRTTWME